MKPVHTINEDKHRFSLAQNINSKGTDFLYCAVEVSDESFVRNGGLNKDIEQSMREALEDALAAHFELRCSWPGCSEIFLGCLLDGDERVPYCGQHFPDFMSQPRDWRVL